MIHKTVIIQGSAKSNGNTSTIIEYLNKNNDFDIIDLKTKNIGYFEYDFSNANDDFIPLMETIAKKYDTIIFATPVYWYNMSGILKTFFDRMSDLLHYKKDLGRLMRGKNMAMISNSGENDLKTGFTMPFIESANYLGMNYLGDTHTWFTSDGKEIHPEAKKNMDAFSTLF
ncbi:flavodoxin family protein [Tenacibaculum insulae]|uniref:flavodoxin family protein n=1 Tax=Tenacibaculum insulae TaxID=2029677 RepID=UPI003AB34FDC